MNDIRILRDRLDFADDAFDAAQVGDDEACAAAVLAQTTTETTYPTTAADYYAVNPVTAGGTEAEGQAATYTADVSTTFYALNLGTSIPPAGTMVILHDVGGRWAFRYD